MPTTIQPPQVPKVQRVTYRPVLVDVSMAQLALGVDAETVYRMADAGELRWVWDVGCGDRTVRALRFWYGEVLCPGPCKRFTQEVVIERIIAHPTEQNLRAVTVGNILLLRRPSIQQMVQDGILTGPMADHCQWIARASLRQFLNDRLQ